MDKAIPPNSASAIERTLAIAVLVICGALGCKDPDPPKPSAPPPIAATSDPVAPFAAFTVPAGTNADGVWVPTFAVRSEIEQGFDYLHASAHCASVHLSLCSEAQWTRACSTDAHVSSVETWTASADADRGFITRGGGTCDMRKVSPGSEIAPSRSAVCCSRAVGIVTANKNTTFLTSTSGKVLAFESAERKGDSAGLRALLADPTTFYGASKSAESVAAILQGLVTKAHDFSVIHDTCDVGTQKEEATWTADCRKIAQQDGQVASVMTRYVWSAEGKITSISDPKVIRAFAVP